MDAMVSRRVAPAARAGGGPAVKAGASTKNVSGPGVGNVPPVRLTRRGRIVVLAFLTGVVGLGVTLIAQPGSADDPTAPQPVVTVHTGDTLWGIAGRYAPARDRFRTMDDIRRLNHLAGYDIWPGEELRLPRLT